MGVDMQISGIDKKSVIKLSKILNISVQEILNKAYDGYGPLSISSISDGYNTLDDLLVDCHLTMDELIVMLLNSPSCLMLNEIISVAYASRNIFKDFFIEYNIKSPYSGEYLILDKKLYIAMLNWLKRKLKSMSVYQAFVLEEKYDEHYLNSMINVCKSMEEWLNKINWKTTLIYYEWDD